MPEVALAIRKFDGDFSSAALFRLDVYDTALAFLVGEAVDDANRLAEFDARLHIQQPAI